MQQQPDSILEILAIDDLPGSYGTHPVGYVNESQLRSISVSRTPQGILGVVRLPHGSDTDDLPASVGARVLLLEDVQDPGNVGTLIRTAAAFDFSGVMLTPGCADPFAPKCVQSTAGAILSVWLRRTARYLSLLEALKQRGYVCVAADIQGDDDPSILATCSHLVLALGNEAAGLSSKLAHLADARVKIPVNTKVESLNVATCGAICMYLSSIQT